MNLFSTFRDLVCADIAALSAAGVLPDGLDCSPVSVEPPRQASHGDIATNAAMVLARQAKRKPRDIAEPLAERLRAHPQVAEVSVAGPGFINMKLHDDFWRSCLSDILAAGPAYGESNLGAGSTINVEYVSANPTGPLHVGHVRGAVFGDALSSLLEKAGFAVTQEYYINDAGSQIDTLARSLHLRYREQFGEDIGKMPEGFYPGDYLIDAAQTLVEQDGEKWLAMDEDGWLDPLRRFAVADMMVRIRADLADLNIKQTVFSSELSLHENGGIQAAHDWLLERGMIYTGVLEPPKGKLPDDWEPRPQVLFKATDYGDDVDRPLQKSDGSWTYFAADIAYHLDKYRRGFTQMIDVWGADHGGYVKRMKAAVKAVSEGEAELDVKLCQIVRLLRDGKPAKMSKRSGDFVTLRHLLEEVGGDVVRFIMLTRKNDAPLDFDFAKVTDQSKDNPVFYVQYAHARIRSVMRNAIRDFPTLALAPADLQAADLTPLCHDAELALIRTMADWPRQVEAAALAHEPHRIAFYLYELAGQLHALWNKGNDEPALRFIMKDDSELTRARLAMICAVAYVIASGLAILGVEPAEEMR